MDKATNWGANWTISASLIFVLVFGIYFPIVFVPPAMPVGVEIEGSRTLLDTYLIPHMPIRVSGNWAYIEKVEDVYNWTSLNVKIGDYPITILTLKMTPLWALPEGVVRQCKLPDKSHWDDYIEFANEAIKIYQPEYVELGNENDAVGNTYPWYGCVGDGKLYAEFVNYVAPKLSGAKVLIGAIANPYGGFLTDLLGELDPNLDIILSWHCYAGFENGELQSTCKRWQKYIRSLTSLPLILSETAVICWDENLNGIDDARIEHFQWLETTQSLAIWYTIANNNWPVECPTCLVINDIPRPVYYYAMYGRNYIVWQQLHLIMW